MNIYRLGTKGMADVRLALHDCGLEMDAREKVGA